MPNAYKIGDSVIVINLPSKSHAKKHKISEVGKIAEIIDDGVDYLYKLEGSGYKFNEDSLASLNEKE